MSTATEAKERPILFSGPMVRAILEGRKTQTRRIVKGKGTWAVVHNPDSSRTWPGAEDECGDWQDFQCPFGDVGDRLWVRETCCCDGWSVHYTADNGHVEFGDTRYDDALKLHHYAGGFSKQVPSIHMPRWASRITLEITGVRVERLQQISDIDCRAESCCYRGWNATDWKHPHNESGWNIERANFASLWSSINAPESWAANPWVWVVDFKRIEQR